MSDFFHKILIWLGDFSQRFWLLYLLVGLFFFIQWQNNGLTTSHYIHQDSRLPDGFDGFVIVQLSDLHLKVFGRDQKPLLSAIRDAKPDIIVFTGDMLDKNSTQWDTVAKLADDLTKIAPVYSISGNHEPQSGVYDELKQAYTDIGVTVLDDDRIKISRADESITLLGAMDLGFAFHKSPELKKEAQRRADRIIPKEGYTILLAHRPEYGLLFDKPNIHLILSGHVHGGQWRIPGIGGIYSTGQGLFPKYSAGTYQLEHSNLIISRGLGGSEFPIRLFNRPDLVVITLKN